MTLPHLFEFMDLQWLPQGLRATIRDILECGNSLPFRPYNRWVADEVLQTAREGKYKRIVELAAGTAPISRLLAKDLRSQGLRFIVCDGNPDIPAYQALEKAHPGTISAQSTALDFSKPQQWEPETLLVLSTAFHHISRPMRSSVLGSLMSSADRVLIFEPLRKTLLSFLLVIGGGVVAPLLPIRFIRRPERFRRFLWCWVIPVAPFLFCWDGFVSCLRQWTEDEWRAELEKLSGSHLSSRVQNWTFCQKIDLCPQRRPG
jgi:hypothetical protein